MKKFLGEFKTFISRGNVMDLAVGVIIGGAFQKIVTSLVGDVVTPVLGLFGSKDFADLVWTFRGVEVKYGAFITAIIDFIIMAFIIFLLVKGINRLTSLTKKPEPVAAPTTKKCPYCCSEIAIEATRCPNCTSQLSE